MGVATPLPEKIVSGGQTGVDRAALDAALDAGVAIGGWCPKGRRAEDGQVPPPYPLQETQSADYEERTRLNVRDSDGTLLLHAGELRGGTRWTAAVAGELGKPLLLVDLDVAPDPRGARDWLAAHHVRVLNVAGPRESERPGIGVLAQRFLQALLEREPR